MVGTYRYTSDAKNINYIVFEKNVDLFLFFPANLKKIGP
jgi:hypothetical protein